MWLDGVPFRHVVVVDTEFNFGGHDTFEEASRSGERQRPVCMVARELRTGQTWRVWHTDRGPRPPFPIGRDTLVDRLLRLSRTWQFSRVGLAEPREHYGPVRRVPRTH